MNIFVGNLNYALSEDELRDLFTEHGDVDSVKIINDRMTGRSKGFGFIEMPNDDEAQSAIDALDGTDVGGRAIKVNKARPPKQRDRRF